MIEIGSRARKLPAPPGVVWRSLTEPHQPAARPWLKLLADEVEPQVLQTDEPLRVVWSSLWPSRPDDEIHLDLAAQDGETLLCYTLLTPGPRPDDSKLGHLRRRLSVIFFADLRFSYGQ